MTVILGRAARFESSNGTVRLRPCMVQNVSYADVAQLAEQLIRNQQVNGSSPFIGFAEWRRGYLIGLISRKAQVRILPLLFARQGRFWVNPAAMLMGGSNPSAVL